MTDFQKSIINLVKSGITGDKIEFPADFDWESAYTLAKKHQIIPIIYYGIINSGIMPPSEIKSKMELETFKLLALNTKQLYELEKICKIFEEKGIEYMPLKGTLLKYIYPKPEMRPMVDADILIKTEQYEEIKPIIIELGYDRVCESDHELTWDKKGALHLELHKRLIPSYNKDYYTYFGDGWRLAKPTDSSKYVLTDEDNLIYLFTHYAKHYRDAGIGIRHILDFKIFLSHNTKLNKKYLENELKKLQLWEFFKNSMDTLEVWFDNKKPNEITEVITDKIFGSGSYGKKEDQIISDSVKKSKRHKNTLYIKGKKAFNMLFLSYSVMKQKYPILVKLPVLLPIMWIVRAVDLIINKKDNIDKYRKNFDTITTEKIDEYQYYLNFVGLDFNFKE